MNKIDLNKAGHLYRPLHEEVCKKLTPSCRSFFILNINHSKIQINMENTDPFVKLITNLFPKIAHLKKTNNCSLAGFKKFLTQLNRKKKA